MFPEFLIFLVHMSMVIWTWQSSGPSGESDKDTILIQWGAPTQEQDSLEGGKTDP